MYHYLYIVRSESGKYYIGRHSTKKLNDGYMGSGKWVRSVREKSKLSKEIISFYDTMEQLKDAEKIAISECIEDCYNMNFNTSPCGFSSGDLNPSHNEEVKTKCSERMGGNNNPSKRKEVREKISKSLKKWYEHHEHPRIGKSHTEETKQKIRTSATGRRVSNETRATLSEINRKRILDGRNPKFNRTGAKHTEESKLKMSNAQKNRPKGKCVHCGKEVSVNTLNRWHNNNCKKRLL